MRWLSLEATTTKAHVSVYHSHAFFSLSLLRRTFKTFRVFQCLGHLSFLGKEPFRVELNFRSLRPPLPF